MRYLPISRLTKTHGPLRNYDFVWGSAVDYFAGGFLDGRFRRLSIEPFAGLPYMSGSPTSGDPGFGWKKTVAKNRIEYQCVSIVFGNLDVRGGFRLLYHVKSI